VEEENAAAVDWGDVQRLFSGRRFQLALETIDYAVYLLDPGGVIRGWTHGAERVLGYPAAEVIGRHFALFYQEAEAEAGQPARELARALERDRLEDEGWRIRKDGSRFWASVTITALRNDAGELRGFVKVTRDRTEHKHQDDRLRAVLEIAQATLAGRGEQAVLELIVRRARTLVDADVAAIAVDDPAGGGLVVRVADGPAAATVEGARFPQGGAPAGLGDALTVPLASGDRRLGALVVGSRPGGRPMAASEATLIELYAAQAAVAVDYRRTRDELQRLAIVQDRERIGRELHDGAIQSLFAVGMGLQGMALLTPDAALRDRLDDAVTQIDEVIRDLRGYIFGLRPGAMADRQLSLSLEELAHQLEERYGVACAVDVVPAVAARLAGRAAEVLQVAREVLANVGRHAAAATCRLSLRAEAGQAVLRVEDDGRGFVPEAVRGRGWGLRNLAERAEALGGSLEVTSVPGEGTAVTLRVPL
jgi:PAS domain S-box-containing protein